MGSRDHPPLSKDSIPASWDSDWLAGWPVHHREAGQEQAEAHHSWDSWEAGKRPQGCEIRGVLSSHTGNMTLHILSHMSITPADELQLICLRSQNSWEKRGAPNNYKTIVLKALTCSLQHAALLLPSSSPQNNCCVVANVVSFFLSEPPALRMLAICLLSFHDSTLRFSACFSLCSSLCVSALLTVLLFSSFSSSL